MNILQMYVKLTLHGQRSQDEYMLKSIKLTFNGQGIKITKFSFMKLTFNG